MNNVRAQSAQRPPDFEHYASHARQSWPSGPEEAGMVTEKLAKLKSPKTSGRHAAFANAPVPEAGGERPAELDQSRLMISKSKTIIAVVLRAESESNPGR
jgi:hypothetical protein